ncbi:TPA: hypothetical protein ACHGWG_002592 [Escherichia coli]
MRPTRRLDKPRLAAHPARQTAPGGASGKTNRTIAGTAKITHSGDSQPPAMREKSTMFLWNK